MATQKPTTRDYDFKSLVIKQDKDHYEPDDAYEFSNRRKFKSTDSSNRSSIYGSGS